MPTILLIIAVTFCTICSQLILKSGVGSIVQVLRQEGIVAFLWAAATSPQVIGALAVQGTGYVIWLFVLAQSRLSTAFATAGSFFYLAMAAASWFFYGERLTPLQWFGLVLISVGVLVLNLTAK